MEFCFGEGTSSKVFLENQPGGLQARKEFKLKVNEEGFLIDEMMIRDLQFSTKLRQFQLYDMSTPNSFVSIYDTSDNIIKMEFVAGGSLQEALYSNRSFTNTEKAKIVYGVAKALDWFHQRDCLHNDIKSDNILLKEDCTPKLADFGTCRMANTEYDFRSIGTYDYMAPEQRNGLVYDNQTKLDIYSLGVVLYEMIAMTRDINFDLITDSPFNELVKCMLDDSPEQRPTAAEICEYLIQNSESLCEDPDDLINYAMQIYDKDNDKVAKLVDLQKASENGFKFASYIIGFISYYCGFQCFENIASYFQKASGFRNADMLLEQLMPLTCRVANDY